MGTSEWVWLIECVLVYIRTKDMILSNLNSYTPLFKISLESLPFEYSVRHYIELIQCQSTTDNVLPF